MGIGSADWINEVEIPRIEAEIHRAEFMAIARGATPISADKDAASFIIGLELEQNTGEFQIEADVGGIRNISGRTLKVNDGLVSFHSVSTNASGKLLRLFSEVSTDKINWTKNADSGRQNTIAGTSEDYGSKSSEKFEWLDNEVLRFRVFATGTGVSFDPVSFLADAETVTGPAVRWRLSEALEPHGA